MIYEFGIKRPDSFVFAKLRNFEQPILLLNNKNLSGLISLNIVLDRTHVIISEIG